MSNYELNVRNLASMGLLDDYYQLYYDIDEIYTEEFKQTKWPNQLQDKAMPKIKKLIESFLLQTVFIFSKEYEVIHPNTEALRNVNGFLNINPKKLTSSDSKLGFDISMKSMNSFLNDFEKMVSEIIVRRKRYDCIYTSVEKEIENISNNILLILKSLEKAETLTVEMCAEDELFIFKSLSQISCNTKIHEVIPKWLYVSLVKDGSTIMLPVHHCLTCGRTFIGIETLKVYEELYGKMLMKMDPDGDCAMSNTALRGESEVHQYGYNVIRGKMSENERHSLLIALIKENKMSEFEIKRDIENAIRIFDGRYSFIQAVQKWKDDLKFISEYSRSNL